MNSKVRKSQRGALKANEHIVSPKQQTTTGCWNVSTMAEATRTAEVAKEVVDGTAVTPGEKAVTTLQCGETVVNAGDDRVQQRGVAMMYSERAKRDSME